MKREQRITGGGSAATGWVADTGWKSGYAGKVLGFLKEGRVGGGGGGGGVAGGAGGGGRAGSGGGRSRGGGGSGGGGGRGSRGGERGGSVDGRPIDGDGGYVEGGGGGGEDLDMDGASDFDDLHDEGMKSRGGMSKTEIDKRMADLGLKVYQTSSTENDEVDDVPRAVIKPKAITITRNPDLRMTMLLAKAVREQQRKQEPKPDLRLCPRTPLRAHVTDAIDCAW
jgi:hypothetical protein